MTLVGVYPNTADKNFGSILELSEGVLNIRMASATMAANKYTFEDSSPSYEFKLGSNSHRRGRKNSYDDENGSLTYSATSSINSKESTDSSFAEIRRILDAGGGDNSKELAAYLKQRQQHQRDSGVSVAGESLAYSTDAESHLRFGGDSLAYSTDSYTRSMATGADSHLQGSDFVSGYVVCDFCTMGKRMIFIF